ncbi:MAG: cysteine hydrolase [Stellaceae bacterium]
MAMAVKGAEIDRSALIIVDMQNDFLHRDGSFGHVAREHPEFNIDIPFLTGTIPNVKRLADAFRAAGRPVVYLAHVLKPDYSDAAFPYWRIGNRAFERQPYALCGGNMGSADRRRVEALESEHLVVKKGFGGFAPSTPLDTILRNMGVTTYVVTGVTTCVCVSTTVRGGVEHNYRMILVSDAVAEVSREAHDAELRTMDRLFADIRTTDDVIGSVGRR